ncbi:MAG: hypothetical protein IKO07_05985 [Clostridia bacterium]|nr:hypothetical protein [Clostridia bacterium]
MTKNDERLNALSDELVPASGKCDSLAGELVRATERIGYRFFNDGDQIGIGYGKETCNPAARFLIRKATKEIADLVAGLWGMASEAGYEAVLDILVGKVADHIEAHPELREQPTPDMWDFYDEHEDVDDSWEEDEEEDNYNEEDEEEEDWDE